MKIKLSELKPFSDEQLDCLSRRDLLVVARSWQKIGLFLEGYVDELEEKVLEIEGRLVRIQAKIFLPSSEKSGKGKSNKDKQKRQKDSKSRSSSSRLPSERYPNAEIIEKDITFEQNPDCQCCGNAMVDSGMVETTEYLSTIPKQFFIVRQNRHKYSCRSCHGGIVTAPGIPRVIPGSSYSDELIVDAALSKYCDLIPMERYCAIAKRQGFEGLPPHSLIGAVIKLALFLRILYELLRKETMRTAVLLVDETRHRMLEGDEKSNLYLWGFLSQDQKSCFFECHGTRSGDVASSVFKLSTCENIVSDVYSGYKKAVRETNEVRQESGQKIIEMGFCNSHARREFKIPGTKDEDLPEEAQFMVAKYKEIYRLEATAKGQTEERILEIRQEMVPSFESMKVYGQAQLEGLSSKSGFAKGFRYFLKNYDGLTLFLKNHLLPIDNNPSERLLRSPVVGRKTWLGTHSKDGAEAAVIHFSLVEACKLNNVNPRKYYIEQIKRIHAKQPLLTPKEYQAALKVPPEPKPSQ